MIKGLPYIDPSYTGQAGQSPYQTGAEAFRVGQGDTGIPAGEPPAPKPIGGYPDQDDEVKRIMSLMMETTKPVPKPSTKQRVLASISDALMAYGGGTPHTTKDIYEPTRQAEEENRNIEARNSQTKRGFIAGEVQSMRQASRDRAIEDRQAAAQRAIDERQRANDERDANIADHERAMALIDSMVKEPGFVLPDEGVLKQLTHSRAQAIVQAHYQKSGLGMVESNLSAFMNEMELEAKKRGLQASFNIPTPGKEGRSASLTPLKPEATNPADRPVDNATMAHASRVGLKLTGKETVVEANNLIAEKEGADREKKFSKPTGRGSNTFYGEIVDWMQLESLANQALQYSDDLGGPIQGSAGNIPMQGIKDWWRGTDVLGQRYDYAGKVASVATAKRKLISGAAVTPSEGAWLDPIIPSATDLDTKRRANLKELANGARGAYLGRAQAAGLSDDDLSEIRRRMSGGLAPLPKKPGDIPLGRND